MAVLLGSVSSAEAQSDTSRIVRAIEIRRLGIFDSAEATRSWLFRLANQLHYETRESVIRSELLFQPGMPIDSAAITETLRNLRGLGLFRNVAIDTVRTDSGLVARVTAADAWTTSPGFDFETTGGQGYFAASFIENNFVGMGSQVLTRYGTYPDYNATELEYTHPRLIANRIDIDVYHERQSSANLSFLVLAYPFRAIASPFGLSLTSRTFDGEVLRYTAGPTARIDTLQNRTTKFFLQAAKAVRANASGYVRVGLIVQVLRNDFLAESSSAAFPSHVSVAVGPTLDISRAHFLTTTNYHHLHQTEDVDLSSSLSIGALVVASSGKHGVAPFARIRLGTELPDGFGILEGMTSGQFLSTGLDSGSAVLGATAVFRLGGNRQRLLFHVEGGIAHNVSPTDQFEMGTTYGPRAFGAHSFTGDRYHLTTAEYRYTISPELGKVAGIGLAVFADHGGAWYAGSTPRSGSDVGIGLRIGQTRDADLRTLGIDLTRRFANDALGAGWMIVVGKGFTFTLAQ